MVSRNGIMKGKIVAASFHESRAASERERERQDEVRHGERTRDDQQHTQMSAGERESK